MSCPPPSFRPTYLPPPTAPSFVFWLFLARHTNPVMIQNISSVFTLSPPHHPFPIIFICVCLAYIALRPINHNPPFPHISRCFLVLFRPIWTVYADYE